MLSKSFLSVYYVIFNFINLSISMYMYIADLLMVVIKLVLHAYLTCLIVLNS